MQSSSATSSRFCNWSVTVILLLVTSQCMIITLDRYYNGIAMSSQSALCGDTSLKHISDGSSIRSGLLLPQRTSLQTQPGPPTELPNEYEGIYARAFDCWGDKPLPCVEPEPNWKDIQEGPTKQGFIFVKPYKTGSSTASGINLRIARNVAKRLNTGYEICKARSDHVWRAAQRYGNRDEGKSFLWSILREPNSRIVSQFFHFKVSREKTEPTDARFEDYMQSGPFTKDYYLQSLSLTQSTSDPVADANRILTDYDFIGITERMDESAVAMAMLLDIPISDILYLTAKGHGGFDDGGGRGGEKICTYIWPSFVSPGMQKVLDSEQWKNNSHWDRALYQAASRSLDLTIETLGREEFMRNLALYEQAQKRSREFCLHKTRFPCSEGGVRSAPGETDCLWNDSGCGCDCLDDVAEKLEITLPSYTG